VENLVLSEFSESTEIWRENVQGVVDFKNLKYLEVFGCNSFRYIFTVSMALGLVQCQELKVKNCPMMEEIIANEGVEEAETGTIMLPRLQFLNIESCPNLMSFYAASITVECPSLNNVNVIDCPKMFALASKFSGELEIETVGGGGNDKSFFNDKVSLFCLCTTAFFFAKFCNGVYKPFHAFFINFFTQ